MTRVRWGVLGAARIATRKVIPAMQSGERCDVVAIASRDLRKAEEAAEMLGIPRAYGSYEELLADRDIEAIYNPLPNHLHLPWTRQAAEAGKHVLCEKPIGLNAAEAEELLHVRDRARVHIQEAFIVRTNPQWLAAADTIRAGHIGELRGFAGTFSYFNDDPSNVRNVADYGGGGLFDIGCYLVNTSRMMFGREPARVSATVERDLRFNVDTLASFVLDFEPGHAIGMCSMQMVAHQRVNLFGTRGRIELEIPFNAPADRPCRIVMDDGTDIHGAGRTVIETGACNQFTIQGDLFSKAVRGEAPLAYPLEDSVLNMRAIDALFRAAESGRWETP
jgi:predicted dehydrogenase